MDVEKFLQRKPDKYQEAIDYLNSLDEGEGTYFGEIAELMQELFGWVYEAEAELATGRGAGSEEISPGLKTREEERKAQQAGFLRQMGDRARRSVQ
jgi:hypothetical protein